MLHNKPKIATPYTNILVVFQMNVFRAITRTKILYEFPLSRTLVTREVHHSPLDFIVVEFA